MITAVVVKNANESIKGEERIVIDIGMLMWPNLGHASQPSPMPTYPNYSEVGLPSHPRSYNYFPFQPPNLGLTNIQMHGVDNSICESNTINEGTNRMQVQDEDRIWSNFDTLVKTVATQLQENDKVKMCEQANRCFLVTLCITIMFIMAYCFLMFIYFVLVLLRAFKIPLLFKM
jgi:hypothetical protein